MAPLVDEHSQPSDPSRCSAMSARTDATMRRIDVRELLGDRREVLIVHGGREYRLRLTSNGKLILTA
jgi:hemin uptake protein HemP